MDIDVNILEKGSLIELKIIDISDSGKGIGKFNGLTIFVDNAVYGQVVKAKITKLKKRYAFASTISVINDVEKGEIQELCDVALTCGGCSLSNVSYKNQLELKAKQVCDKLNKLGMQNLDEVEIVGNDFDLGYRNKSVFTVGKNQIKNLNHFDGACEDSVKIGFLKNKSHDVVDIESCLIQDDVTTFIIQAIKDFIKEDAISAYDYKTQTGLMRHIMIRVSKTTGQVMIVFSINGKEIKGEDKLLNYIQENIQALNDMILDEGEDFEYTLKSVYITAHKKHNSINTLFGEDTYLIFGNKTIVDVMGNGMKFEISPESFYQVNSYMAEKLYSTAIEYAGDYDKVVDLYCGIGSIGLTAVKDGGSLIGIELVKSAILNANCNAVINNIVNARFLCGKAEDVVPKLISDEKIGKLDDRALSLMNTDVVFLDPPRSGCDEVLLDSVIEIAPKKIVYISCDPATLARDVRILSGQGYQLQKVKAFDLFSHTLHVETVALIQRVKS